MNFRNVFTTVLLSLFLLLCGCGAGSGPSVTDKYSVKGLSIFSGPAKSQGINDSVSLEPVSKRTYQDNKEYIVVPANKIISRKSEDPSWITYPSIIDREREGFPVSALYIFFIMALYLMKKMGFSSSSGENS